MLTATAVARSSGATTFTIAELIGPVDANSSTSATTIAAQYTAGTGDVSATSATGAATSVAIPETQRYDCLVSRSRASPIQPPAEMPRKPVPARITPNHEVAVASGSARTRIRNFGMKAAMPPSANV